MKEGIDFMGYNTDFTGAIRITPRIDEPLAGKLEQWLELRHMRRDVAALEHLYVTKEERSAHTLFSDDNFGQEGEFYLPDKTKDLNLSFSQEEPYPEGLADNLAMSFPPKSCPSLYCDLALVHSQDADCSYIGWTGAEKAYEIPDWLKLLASYLVPRGYNLYGTLFANGESGNDFYYIRVNDEDVKVEDLEPESTYCSEFSELYYGY